MTTSAWRGEKSNHDGEMLEMTKLGPFPCTLELSWCGGSAVGKFPFHTISNPNKERLNHIENILIPKMGGSFELQEGNLRDQLPPLGALSQYIDQQ